MNFKHVTYFWCFLEVFIGKFIPNIDNEHAQDHSYPGATFAFFSHRENLPRRVGLPGVVQRVSRLSKLPRGNPGGTSILGGRRGLAPKFVSEILVEAPDFASKI